MGTKRLTSRTKLGVATGKPETHTKPSSSELALGHKKYYLSYGQAADLRCPVYYGLLDPKHKDYCGKRYPLWSKAQLKGLCLSE